MNKRSSTRLDLFQTAWAASQMIQAFDDETIYFSLQSTHVPFTKHFRPTKRTGKITKENNIDTLRQIESTSSPKVLKKMWTNGKKIERSIHNHLLYLNMFNVQRLLFGYLLTGQFIDPHIALLLFFFLTLEPNASYFFARYTASIYLHRDSPTVSITRNVKRSDNPTECVRLLQFTRKNTASFHLYVFIYN